MPPQAAQSGVQRAQLQYPLDRESEGALKRALDNVLKDVIVTSNRYPLTLLAGATFFGVGSSYMEMRAQAAVTIAQIRGGREGMLLTLEFIDTNVTITDDNTAAVDTINLNFAFTSVAGATLQLLHDGISWREISRRFASDAFVPSSGGTYTGDISVPDEAYGAPWNASTEVPTKNAVYDKIESLPTLASGVYSPTRSAEVNMDANVTMTEAQYMRVGATVTVSGRFTADPTLTTSTTSFETDLPVASNIGAIEDLAGVAFCGNIVSMGAEVTGSVANNTAVITWKASDVTSQTWSYTFTYQVI